MSDMYEGEIGIVKLMSNGKPLIFGKDREFGLVQEGF